MPERSISLIAVVLSVNPSIARQAIAKHSAEWGQL